MPPPLPPRKAQERPDRMVGFASMLRPNPHGAEREPPAPAADLPAGVGIPAGVQPLAHLAQVVDSLRAAWGPRRPLILTHRTPDPDALGAMFGLELLLRRAFG